MLLSKPCTNFYKDQHVLEHDTPSMFTVQMFSRLYNRTEFVYGSPKKKITPICVGSGTQVKQLRNYIQIYICR